VLTGKVTLSLRGEDGISTLEQPIHPEPDRFDGGKISAQRRGGRPRWAACRQQQSGNSDGK
jgi:hypothetical protein